MNLSVRRFLRAIFSRISWLPTSKVPVAANYGIVDISAVQPLCFSLEAFTGQKIKTNSGRWW